MSQVKNRSTAAVAALPVGRYGIGVSGGADSTALSRLLHARGDCKGVLIHLDHELRGQASTEDAAFVKALADSIGWPAVIEKRSAHSADDDSSNPQAAYRAARLRLFARVMAEHKLDAVLLAHHANDQAETVLLRVVRGGGLESLAAMYPERRVNGVRLLRPLLDVPGEELRAYLRAIGQSWREDASNEDPRYRRTLARRLLATEPIMVPVLCKLARFARVYVELLDMAAPELGEQFGVTELANLPLPVARHAVRRWLANHGGPADDLSQSVCDRLVRQALDPVSTARQHYPGGVLVQRSYGVVEAFKTA